MSVLIKVMKKPDNCEVCPYAFCHLDTRNCPIVEIHDHGDLIDRDMVVMRLAEWSNSLIETYGENDEYVKCLSEVLEGLGYYDVVIPAERSEDAAN